MNILSLMSVVSPASFTYEHDPYEYSSFSITDAEFETMMEKMLTIGAAALFFILVTTVLYYVFYIRALICANNIKKTMHTRHMIEERQASTATILLGISMIWPIFGGMMNIVCIICNIIGLVFLYNAAKTLEDELERTGTNDLRHDPLSDAKSRIITCGVLMGVTFLIEVALIGYLIFFSFSMMDTINMFPVQDDIHIASIAGSMIHI